MSFSIFITAIIAIVGIVIFWIKNKFSYWERHGFDYISPEFPYGNLKGVGQTVHFSTLSKKFYEKYKNKAPAVGLYFFTAPVLFVTSLDLVKNILLRDFQNFHDRGLYTNKKADPISSHLFAIEGNEWRQMRNKLSPTFTSGKMKMMFGTVQKICMEMINYLKKQQFPVELEMKDILARYTTDVIGNVAFGLDVDSIENPNSLFRTMGAKAFNPPTSHTMKILFITTFRKFAQNFPFRVIQKDVSDFFMSSIRQTVDYREKNNIVRNDFFNLLLELKNHGKLKDDAGEALERLTFDELAAQSFLFFLAGFETSSTTLTFALYSLALNLDAQEKLRSEIQTVLAKHGNQLTYEAMMEMKYLQMVIDETLRMYPPVDTLVRIAANDYQIPDTKLVVEKDTLVFIPAYAIHHDPDVHENPENFEPERFSDENKAKMHAMAHQPFGDGPRNCIGLRFGLMQTKVGLINLLQNFKFLPCGKTTIPMEFLEKSQVLAPKYDMWLKIEKL